MIPAEVRILLLATGWCLAGGVAGAVTNDECLACHGETTAASKLPASAHAKLQCVDCHASLASAEMPHPTPVAPVECAGCHKAQQGVFAQSLHGKALARGDVLAPRCQSCHGRHDIAPVASPASPVAPTRVPFVCGSCHREGGKVTTQRTIHQDHILENYSESIHGLGLLKKGLSVAANCASCHTAHLILPHTDPRSSISRANVPGTCMKCHAMIESVHRKIIAGSLWESEPDKVPVCVDCHQPHKARKVFYDQGVADRDCLTCHGKPDLKAASGKPLAVRRSELQGSVHVRTGCAQCHTGVSPAHARPCDTVILKVDCSICHTAPVDDYRRGRHGQLAAEGDRNAPKCSDCHGTHGVRGRRDIASPTYPTNVPQLCANCHREGRKAAVRYTGTEHRIPEHYTESIHGKGLLKSGLLVTATCSSCHTPHRALPAADPASSVNPRNVASTCAQCHHGVYEAFNRSVHSPAVTKTTKPLPGCNDCHSAHTIKRADLEGFRMDIMGKCGRCHLETANTYFETYHGKVTRLGYAKTAKCHDCHGAHGILPASDPRSTLNRLNVTETCRKCHPGATRRFAGYFTHATHHNPKKFPLLFLSFWGMTLLLVGTFLMGGIHTLLWLPRSLELRRKHLPGGDPGPGRQYRRFEPLESVLHVLMIVSFLSLALTGMTLKFSYTPWAAALSGALGGFHAAGLIHRAAALLMIGVFAVHLRSLFRRKRAAGRTWWAMLTGPDTLMMTRQDLDEIVGTLKWFLRKGERPRYGHWTYWEKFDYFAVFWGIAIIGSTGLVLWFPEVLTRVLPGWAINVATIVHSDEALLATGFIFTVHFFNTHFRPDRFPMDLVIFTGRMPVDELAHDRPAEYEALHEAGTLTAGLVDPPDPRLVRAARIFGTIALSIGLVLTVAIIYAMVFSYR
ncbi:MAG: cytochrome c3 family protein [Candidatus Coatesbacteria bacterium]